MKNRSIVFISALALAASVALTGCGNNDEPLSQAQMQRRMQEQQLNADREAQRIQNEMAREQLRQQQVQTQAMQQQLGYNQPQVVQQPVYQTAPQQPVVVDQGIGTGTAIVGAAAAAGVGYMAGKAMSNNSNSYPRQTTINQTRTTTYVPSAPRPVATTSYRPAAPKPAVRPAPVSKVSAGYSPMSKLKSSSSYRRK